MCEDHFPINARMIGLYELEGQNMQRLVTIDLSVDFWLVKPDNVRKRELFVKTEERMRIYEQKHSVYGELSVTTISIRRP